MSPIYTHLQTNNWELIKPFERNSKGKTIDDLLDGESEYEVCSSHVHIVEWDGQPPLYTQLEGDDLKEFLENPFSFRTNKKSLYRSKCFLWIIDQESLKIAREEIRNEKRVHDSAYICHTNLSGAGKAYIGGEVLFDAEHTAYVNFFSDRYGGENTPKDLWEHAKNVFKDLGYEKLIDFFDLV